MTITDQKIRKRAKAHQKYYTSDGTQVPGVTTILGVIDKSRMLVPWANKLGLQGIESGKYVDETAVIGTLAHEMVQQDLGGPDWDRAKYSPDQVDQAENAFLKYLEWAKGRTMKTVFIEEQMVSDKYRFGGTVDWFGEMDGKTWLIDIKTSKALYPEHLYQVSAYRRLLVEKGLKVDRVGVLRIGRSEDEGFEFRSISDPEITAGWRVFTSAHKLYLSVKDFERRQK